MRIKIKNQESECILGNYPPLREDPLDELTPPPLLGRDPEDRELDPEDLEGDEERVLGPEGLDEERGVRTCRSVLDDGGLTLEGVASLRTSFCILSGRRSPREESVFCLLTSLREYRDPCEVASGPFETDAGEFLLNTLERLVSSGLVLPDDIPFSLDTVLPLEAPDSE